MEHCHQICKRLEDLVWLSAKNNPHAIAIDRPPQVGETEAQREQVSYAALKSRVTQWAKQLTVILDESINISEKVIALALKRNQIDAYIALLSTLEAGASYLVFDENLPKNRARLMLSDAQPQILLCEDEDWQVWSQVLKEMNPAHTGTSGSLGPTLISLSQIIELQSSQSMMGMKTQTERLDTVADPKINQSQKRDDQLAYLIYTSGSSGTPKGVMIEHRNILPLLLDDLTVFDLGPGDRILQGSSHAYDSSVEEMFMAWSAGATVVIGNDDTMRLGPDLASWIMNEKISLIAPPPTLLRAIGEAGTVQKLAKNSALRYVYVGGEALPLDVAQLWSKYFILVNGYGPTECAVTVTRAWISPKDDMITIGRPHPQASTYVVNDKLELVAFGESGELVIAGEILARGYLGQPKLTEERFPTHPKLGRIYRTGDLVCEDSNGNINFLGRIDSQIKLRGYRLELAEVEVHLAHLPKVREVVCTVIGSGIKQRLIALFVPHNMDSYQLPNTDHFETSLQFIENISLDLSSLQKNLPHYMMPSQAIAVAMLPRLMSGKIDRKKVTECLAELMISEEGEQTSLEKINSELIALRQLELNTIDQEYSDGHNKLQSSLVSLLGAVLETEEVTADSDFFEHGGDSILAAAFISHLRSVPFLAHLTVRQIYEKRTINQLIDLVIQDRKHKQTLSISADSVNKDAQLENWRILQHSMTTQKVWICTVLQALWIILSTLGRLGSLAYIIYALSPWFVVLEHHASLLLLGLWLFFPFLPLMTLYPRVMSVLALKKLLITKYQPLKAPIWSMLYFKQWLIQRFTRFIPWATIQGSPLYAWTLRQLGAQIGREVYFHRGVDLSVAAWDLIKIGDQVTLGRDCSLRTIDYEYLHMHWGSIKIESGCSLGIRSGLARDTYLAEKVQLDDHTMIHLGKTISSRQFISGAKAETQYSLDEEDSKYCSFGLSEKVYGFEFHKQQILTSWLLGLPWLMIALGLIYLLPFIQSSSGSWSLVFDINKDMIEPIYHLVSMSQLNYIELLKSLIAISLFSFVFLSMWLIYLAILYRYRGKVLVGKQAIRSRSMTIAWQKESILIQANRWLSGTIFWPYWLRLAGMKIGADSEVSTIMECVLEQTTVEGRCFSADGIYFAAPRLAHGWVSFAYTHFEKDVFLGNHSVIPAGTRLPKNSLLGVCTVYESKFGQGYWFGHPAFQLPRREIIAVREEYTHRPSRIRYCSRVMWEIARVGIPIIILVESILWLALIPSFNEFTHLTNDLMTGQIISAVSWSQISGFILWTSVIAVLNILLVCCLKWILLGKVKRGQHPLWSCWCSRWDLVYVYWGELARFTLRELEGTLLLNMVLRCFGVRIGKKVFLGRGFAQVVDPDMLHFEDKCTVMNLFQAHSFEDRVLKTAPVYFEEGASVGSGTVVLYGAKIGAYSQVQEQSVVMKGEVLNSRSSYSGAPSSLV